MVSRAQAIENGLLTYFTGKQCKNGHIADRLVSNRMCVLCRSEYVVRYYLENRDAALERDRRYYLENRTAVLERQSNYREQNKDAIAEKNSRYRKENPEAVRESGRKHYRKNRATVLVKQRKYSQQNPDKSVAKRSLRRSRGRKAVPKWFDEFDHFVWVEAADLVRRRRAATGINWAADHMIPLVAKDACGLHVAGNCQVIPATMNLSKNNKMIFTEPLDWLRHI